MECCLPTGIYFFKVSSENTRTMSEILTLKVNNKDTRINVIDVILVCLLLTLNRFHKLLLVDVTCQYLGLSIER